MQVTSTALAAALLLAAMSGPAFAQERSMNDGAPGLLRTWPQAGVWQTALSRLRDGSLGCVMLTSHTNVGTDDRYGWGVVWREDRTSLEIIDKSPVATSGPTIDVFIDNLRIGIYRVTQKLEAAGFNTMVAALTGPAKDSVPRLLRTGGAVKFVTSKATYAASLQGAPQALRDADVCVRELRDIDAAQQPGAN